MTAYLIGKLQVENWDWHREYSAITEPLVAEYGGVYLVKGGKPAILEGGDTLGSVRVMIAFPSRQALENWYNDPRYAPMIALRESAGVKTDLFVVNGVDEA